MSRLNPISIDLTGVENPAGVEQEFQFVVKQITEADKSRDDWGSKQRKYTRQRYGVRRGKQSIPWKNAANLNVPLIDKAIRRWKPGIVRLVADAEPVAHFFATEPNDVDSARIAERFYNWLFKWEMDSLDSVVYLADMVAQRGTGWVEVGWEYRTEPTARIVDVQQLFAPLGGIPADDNGIIRVLAQNYDLNPDRPDHVAVFRDAIQAIRAGAPRFKIGYRAVVRDRPSLVVHDPIQVITPLREIDEGQAKYICIQNIFSRDDLLAMANDNLLDPEAVRFVLDKIEERIQDTNEGDAASAMGVVSPGQLIRQERDIVDELVGIIASHEDPENVEVWKIYTWLGGKRAVIWYHPSTKTRLATLDFVYPFARWPMKRVDFEKTHSKRILSSRGIPALLSDLQIELNKLHNARLNAIDIQLAPVFLVRSTANFTRTLRWAPGTGFPVSHPDDVRPLVQDLRNLQAYTQEEQFTRLLSEEYVGIYDASLGSPSSPAEARTATEIEAIQAQVSGIFSLDAALWQKAWRDIHAMTFDMWLELGDYQTYIRVTGSDKPILVMKHEIRRHYDIQPAGTPTNTNKAMELARAREAMQIYWNPFTAQTGLVNMQKLADWYTSAHDFNQAKRIVRSEQEATEQQTLMQAAGVLAEGGLQDLFSSANSVRGQQAGRNAR